MYLNILKKLFDHEYKELRRFNSIADKVMALDEEYSKLGNTIDMVIHSAAYVSHYGDEHLFELINVTGTNNIIDFCSNFSIQLAFEF